MMGKIKAGWAAPAALLALTVGLFFPAGRFDFVGFDDAGHIFANPYLHPASLGGAAHFWTDPYNHLYMPLVFSLWSALAVWAQRGNPAALLRDFPALFHWANIVVHSANVLLAYSLLAALLERARLDARERVRAAFLGALLFAWHPLQVESVAWASGMKDLLCGFFSLLALRLYVEFALRGGKSRALYAAAVASFLLALTAKPAAAALPFFKLSLDVWILDRDRPLALRWAALWLALAAPFLVLNKLLQPTGHLDTLTPFWTRPFIAADSVAFYLRKLVMPTGLSLDYGRTPRAVLASPWGWLSCLIPAGLLIGLTRLKGGKWLLAGFCVFIAGIFPTCGIVPFQHQLMSTVADRYAYLSMLGASIALAGAMTRARGRRAWLAAAALAALGGTARRQLLCWRDSYSLFSSILEANPDSAVFHNNMAGLLWRSGRTDEALEQYRAALRARPSYMRAHNDMGALYLTLGKAEEAEAHHRTALAGGDPTDVARAHLELARDELSRGRRFESRRHDALALRAQQLCDIALTNLGDLSAGDGDREAAARYHRLAADVREAQGLPAQEVRLDPWPTGRLLRQ